MITALLLPLLLGLPDRVATRVDHTAGGDDPAIQIWISDNRRFLPGDRAKVQVRSREDGYLVVLHADPDGHLRVLFPIDPRDDNFVRGGRKYEIRGRAGRESFTADNGKGRGTVYAAVSHDPLRFDQFVLGDHWDYRQLAPQRLAADPEPELNDLVRRMADGGFDYDILTYDVVERVVYASDYSGSYYDSYSCGYSYYGCGRSYYGSPYSLSVGLFFGRPYYRRHYYDPFYASYDPYYDPFFYDPYYYRPAYYRPVYVRPVYGYPYYNYPYAGYYHNRNRGWDRPYTPYRFRPADGTYANYRDRRYDLRRSVNTVYLPPKVQGRTPANASPIRRVTGEREVGGTQPNVERRTKMPVGDATARRSAGQPAERGGDSRLTRPNIEARRAREPEDRGATMPDRRDAREQARDRRDLPTEVKPQSRTDDAPRRAVERPQEVRGGDSRPEPRAEPSRAEPRRAEPVRSDPPASDRGSARGNDRGDDRGSYAPPSRSSDGGSSRGSMGGGERGGGGGGGSGGDRGGARRR
ncbi:MAG TPA: DUF4384 domain-containing protein [Gemmatimonadales bacterium]|nr:DUF4384 domain-containing protein [Gemmatimonadales bacterium]